MSRIPNPSPVDPPAPAGWWRWINRLGLDAVAVAVVWLHVFGRAFGTRIEPVEAWILGAAVWVVYAVDRLLDGWCPPPDRAPQDRHRFAVRHRAWLIAGVAACTVAGAVAGFFLLRAGVVAAGTRFSMLLGCYFACVWLSRREPPATVAFVAVHAVLMAMLVNGLTSLPPITLAWRAFFAGALAIALAAGLRSFRSGALPWTLSRKLFAGLLFAVGCSLAPLAHLEEWEALLRAPVMLFGIVCALNSLGIRIWESPRSAAGEDALLAGAYPWLLAATAGAAFAECAGTSPFFRPGLAATGAAAVLLLGIHALRRRLPAALLALFADAAVLASGAAALAFLPA